MNADTDHGQAACLNRYLLYDRSNGKKGEGRLEDKSRARRHVISTHRPARRVLNESLSCEELRHPLLIHLTSLSYSVTT